MLAVSAADGSTWAEGVAWPGITDWEVSHDGGLLAVAVGNRVVYQYESPTASNVEAPHGRRRDAMLSTPLMVACFFLGRGQHESR